MTARRYFVSVLFVLLSASLSPSVTSARQPSGVADAAREQAAMDRALQTFRERAKRGTLDEMTKAREQLTALRTQEATFDSRLEALKQNDEGKRLAADPTAVAAIYHQGLARPVVTVQGIDTRIAEIDRAVSKLNAANDPAAMDDAISTVRDLPFQVRAWVPMRSAELTERSHWFDAALQRAPALTDAGAAPTLAKTLDAYAVEFDKWSAELFRKGMQVAKQEKEQEAVERGRLAALLQAEQKLRLMEEQGRLQMDEEQARHRAELEKKLDQIAALDRENAALRANRALQDAKSQTAVSAVQNEAEHEQLRKRCKDSEVQTLLQPFITPGYWALTTNDRTATGVDKKPISLNALKSAGALNADDKGYLELTRIATVKYNDRPHWSITYQGGRTFQKATEKQRDDVRKAQQLLNELGPTLVELGMLSE